MYRGNSKNISCSQRATYFDVRAATQRPVFILPWQRTCIYGTDFAGVVGAIKTMLHFEAILMCHSFIGSDAATSPIAMQRQLGEAL
jgi:hypothetical protein